MPSTLIITSGDKGKELLQRVLTEMGFDQLSVCTGGSESRRLFTDGDWDVIVINAPLTDENGHDLATHAVAQTSAGVVLLVRAEIADEVAERVEDAGVLVVSKPLNRQLLHSALKMALAARRRLTGLAQQNNLLQKKIEDIRLVDRAKCALIQYRQLTEPQAHKYIEQEAMDSRKSRRVVAEEILAALEGSG